MYDSQQYSLSLDEQRRLVGLSGITGSLDIVLTNSNADSNTLYGKDYAQNHGILLLSPTTYAGVNSNAWPKNNENTNFITQYSQSNNSKIIGFDYVITITTVPQSKNYHKHIPILIKILNNGGKQCFQT